jgi:hypothetical protein
MRWMILIRIFIYCVLLNWLMKNNGVERITQKSL